MDDLLVIKTPSCFLFKEKKDLVLCEKTDRKCIFYFTNQEEIESNCALSSIESMLDNDNRFFRFHSKYIINIKYITSYFPKTREVLLKNNKTVLVAKDRKDDFQKKTKMMRNH